MRGKTQLADGVCAEVHRRLAQRQAVQRIARELGLDRQTVRDLRDGRSAGPKYERCPEGHLTILPCRTCAARQLGQQITEVRQCA